MQVSTKRVEKRMEQEKGGYGLGSGNRVPYYIPQENYLPIIMTTGRK
jgi:hypothetical protein